MPNPEMFNTRSPQNAGVGGFPKAAGFVSGFTTALNRKQRRKAARGGVAPSGGGGPSIKAMRVAGRQNRKTLRTQAAMETVVHGKKVEAAVGAAKALGKRVSRLDVSEGGGVSVTNRGPKNKKKRNNEAGSPSPTQAQTPSAGSPKAGSKPTPAGGGKPSPKPSASKPSMSRKAAETQLKAAHPLGSAYVKKTKVSNLSENEKKIHQEHLDKNKAARAALRAHDVRDAMKNASKGNVK